EAIINNTYNPEEESPRFTKNKLREKASIAEKINNDIVSGEENKKTKSNKKKKKSLLQEQLNEEENLYEAKLESFEKKINDFPKKKTKSKSQTDVPHQEGDRKIKNSLTEARNVTELEEEEELIRAYQLHVAEDEANAIKKKIRMKLKEQMSEFTSTVQSHEVVLNNEVGKKKKKKKEIAALSEAETRYHDKLYTLQHHPVEDGNENQSLEEQKLEESMEKQKPKAKKVKKKTRKVAVENDEEMKNSEISTQSKFGVDDGRVLGVYIHRSDRLKTDLLVSHPMVKIHVVDQRSGLYVKKDHSKRKVSSYYEQEQIEHVLPIMTQPYDFRQSKSTIPEWEEQVIFNECFSYFIQNTEESPRVILFFEILDFLSMDGVRANSDVQIQEHGFRKICWAFLKLVGANGVLNIDGKLRLQLYYPPPRTKSHSNAVEVYDWWAKCPRNRYPSTLYVTVRGIKLPDHVAPSFRSMIAVQQEQSSATLCELQREGSKKSCEPFPEKKEPFKWTRLPGQACRLPNKHLFSLRGGDMGCFCIRFSHDGKTLAAACAGKNGYPIVLYEIPSGQFLREFYGHLNIVYDLCWSKDNQHLLTASSDGTVRMWKIEMQAASAVRVFPHPSFVYTAKYHPVADSLVVTGCYDSVIRIWNANVKEIHGQLLQELDGHKSFINALCFDAEGLHMFSGDSSGLIIVWDTSVKGSFQHWRINKEIKENDIKGTPINHLEVHPNGRRLLIHAKDSTLRIMDLRILATKKYIGATNYREKIHSTLTPCGTFLFSGSEDGRAYVWNPETGDQVAIYSELSFTSPLRDVAFHPHEHMVSFCAFGQNQPILVYIYDYKVAQQEAELVKDLSSSLTTAAPRGPQLFSSFSEIPVQRSSAMCPADQFVSVARASMRMQKVKQKLDSVMVVALYDYTAHRSDELTIHRSDIIQVLYKDNDNWWFGSLANGQQGYFPANYVAATSVKTLEFPPTLIENVQFPTKWISV
uniref:Jouberin n=1 Tax=Buteo japonicus TaxID=224669 RepID=A0A8C0BYM2_9AVES